MREKNTALVAFDLEAEKIKKFDTTYAKLMNQIEDEVLEERYAGKKSLITEPSLGGLARIKLGKYDPKNPKKRPMDVS